MAEPARSTLAALKRGRPRKLALIGPVAPFRGGIAQYTTELHRALLSACQLQTISFRRLYPAMLYPGRSDREPGMESYAEPHVDYLLDAFNPLTWRAAARRVAKRGCDLAVLEWWTLFWAPGFAWMARMLRKRGVPVAFLCHNLFDHDSGALKRAVTIHLLSQAQAYIVHARDHADRLRSLFPGKPVRVHPLPAYDRFPEAESPAPRRGRLELLFFGFIRPYKGLDVLIEALGRLSDPDVHLTVVGEPWGSVDELHARIRSSGALNVDLHLKYVDDATAANFFGRADLVVLPYRTDTPSGVAALAYRYGRPVLASRVAGLREVVEEGRTGFLVDPASPEQLAERLRTIDRTNLEQMRTHVRSYASSRGWPSLAAELLGLADELECQS